MADWRDALQDAMYPVLTRLLQEGFVLPLFVTCIGRNGSMMCGRYDDIEATGLDFIFEAWHLEGEAFPLPIHMLIVDQRGRPDTYGTSAREDKTLMTLACEASNVLLPEFYIGILAEMFDILFDQLSQLPRLANLDPVVHRPEEAVALGLKRAALGINELEDHPWGMVRIRVYAMHEISH